MDKHVSHSLFKIIEEEAAIPRYIKDRIIGKMVTVLDMPAEPISSLEWVPIHRISPNSYNPNKMAPPEKKSLRRSLCNHGITSPLIVSPAKEGIYTLIDGYHRLSIIKSNKGLRERLENKVPVVVMKLSECDRIVATIRHNRARGKHQIGEISNVIKTLSQYGWPAAKIMAELGMDSDEVLRLKQFQGLGELFKNENYSNSWK